MMTIKSLQKWRLRKFFSGCLNYNGAGGSFSKSGEVVEFCVVIGKSSNRKQRVLEKLPVLWGEGNLPISA